MSLDLSSLEHETRILLEVRLHQCKASAFNQQDFPILVPHLPSRQQIVPTCGKCPKYGKPLGGNDWDEANNSLVADAQD